MYISTVSTNTFCLFNQIEIYAQDDLKVLETNLTNENPQQVEREVAVGKEMGSNEETDYSQRKAEIEVMIQESLVNSILHHKTVVT